MHKDPAAYRAYQRTWQRAYQQRRRATRSEADRQRDLAYLADYRERNRERLQAGDRAYRAGLTPERKAAKRAQAQAHYQANREANIAKSRAYNQAHREERLAYARQHGRWNKIRLKYGLTRDAFEGMLSDQDGRCLICSTELAPRTVHVDHDHATGAVRGLLCGSCNRAIGIFKDDPALMRRAAAYIEGHHARTICSTGGPTLPSRSNHMAREG